MYRELVRSFSKFNFSQIKGVSEGQIKFIITFYFGNRDKCNSYFNSGAIGCKNDLLKKIIKIIPDSGNRKYYSDPFESSLELVLFQDYDPSLDYDEIIKNISELYDCNKWIELLGNYKGESIYLTN